MPITTQDSRIIIKRSSTAAQVPTVAPSNDHTDGSWNALNIYKGELFINLVDSKIYMRDDSGIQRLALYSDVTANNELKEVLANGNKTNQIAITSNNTTASLKVFDLFSGLYFGTESVTVEASQIGIGHSTKISIAAPIVEINDGTILQSSNANVEINFGSGTFLQLEQKTGSDIILKTSGYVNVIQGNLYLGKPSVAKGKILFANNTNSNELTIQSGVTSASHTLTLPTAQGAANTFLKNDGAGILSWAAASGGGGGGISHATASGTDTYTATVTGVTAYNDGDAYLIRFTNGNTTSCTLNINSLGAVDLYRNNDGPLIGGDIQAGGEMLCVYNSTLGVFQSIGSSPNSVIAYITNADSVTITKGQPVYAFSGTGDRMTVKLAYNTIDATSAQTVGLVLSTSIAAGQKGFIITQGLLDGLSTLPTSTFTDGDPIYLGSTAGTITNIKPYAPNHLVYLGVVTTASAGSAGRMYVKVQNGYELDELHNVQAQSPTNKDTLYYDSADSQWKTAQIATILGYNPATSNLFSYYNFI
jgi:hypothetical protein